ncbi:sugar ABC transporter permease [Galbitalea sp. SE-J8]|uniref:carbohydrate ABC transporter permease n=1 Tax=Galbitalea sp. SE-J8 TaxID=3054952 RepID=UPI00259CC103|nr:sugar ABC transporter permease [Galbitalea sp. SE-J8]
MTVDPASAVSAGAAPRRRRHRHDWRGWTFVGPFMIVFLLVFIAPLVYALVLSTFTDRMIGGVQFVGFANFLTLFQDPQFWASLGRVTLVLLVQVPIMLLLSMFLALAIDSGRLHGTNFFRISIFIPYLVPAVVSALMWGFMYGARYGLVGQLNRALGTGIDLFSPDWILGAIGNVITWEYVGYNMLIFYSALTTVPGSLYEAAVIDGANEWQVIRAIKLPQLRGALAIATIFSIIGTFQLFNEPSVMQKMAPSVINGSFTPNLYAFNLSFGSRQQGYAAALAIVMGLITVAIAYVVQLRGMRANDEGRGRRAR